MFRFPFARKRETPESALAEALPALLLAPEEALVRAEPVRNAFLEQSPRVRKGDFDRLEEADLALLFRLYDALIFKDFLGTAVSKLSFRLSKRMTSAAGKLLTFRSVGDWRYEIAISSHLLFLNFHEGSGAEVNGLVCRDRLDALLKIFEHELLHLVERLSRGNTSCRGKNFKVLAEGLFGHRDVTHQLETRQSRAHRDHGIFVGCAVTFPYRGGFLSGRVNRVGKRATVLVPDPKGRLYTDGGRYRKFYVQLAGLTKG